MNMCKNCFIQIDESRKFCSKSCSAKYNNIGVRRHGEERFCLNCNNKTTNKKFCSNTCQQDFEWVKEKKKIEKTGIAPYARTSKRYIIETRGHRCEICKETEWMGQKIPLVKDHIDGNPENHSILNLRVICPNCDAQTPTYKSKNKGNGRVYRRRRYAEGKSY
jgi:hypothetical protein